MHVKKKHATNVYVFYLLQCARRISFQRFRVNSLRFSRPTPIVFDAAVSRGKGNHAADSLIMVENLILENPCFYFCLSPALLWPIVLSSAPAPPPDPLLSMPHPCTHICMPKAGPVVHCFQPLPQWWLNRPFPLSQHNGVHFFSVQSNHFPPPRTSIPPSVDPATLAGVKSKVGI